MYKNQEIGKLGEKLAVKYLIDKGYEVIKQNFRCKQGEIDIIALKENEIIFIEVKTRTTLEFGSPAEAVNKTKIEHMLNSAKYYLYAHNIKNENIRFDTIEVFFYKSRYTINHIKQIM